SGLETVQVIQFAARAAQLAQELFGDTVERRFLARLALAKSNLAEHENGRQIYEKFVRPAVVDWERVGAHYAISSLFATYPDKTDIYCYRAERTRYQVFAAGNARLAVGQVTMISKITGGATELSFGVLHIGDHTVNGGVRTALNDDVERYLERELAEPFLRADFAEVIRLMDRRFGESNYTLRALFRDEQRTILQQILTSTLDEAESLYRQVYEHRAPMLRFLLDLHIPPPKAIHAAAEFVLNQQLRHALEQEIIEIDKVKGALQAAKLEQVALDRATLEFTYRRNLEKIAKRFQLEPSTENLRAFDNATSLLTTLPFGVNLWNVQNRFYRLIEASLPRMRERQQRGDPEAAAWLQRFNAVAEKLGVKIN
ncbi:MAG: DUF3536 domain-containing protein, partial [Deltaproteobacteria bacterium]|nr:DUF3536 domain-containing protein [Deltaproteobacteria bacterium]